MLSRSLGITRTKGGRVFLKNIRNLSSKTNKGKAGVKNNSVKPSENSSTATHKTESIQQQSLKGEEKIASKEQHISQKTPNQQNTPKKPMGAFSKTILGAAVGLPVGLLIGMKLSPDFFYQCEDRYPQAVAFIRQYIPLGWPAQEPKHEHIEEEEEGPITITLKQEDLAEEIQQLIQSVDKANATVDGVEISRILSVLADAREMLEKEKELLLTALCEVTPSDFAIQEEEIEEEEIEEEIEEKIEEKIEEVFEEKEEEEEEWHVLEAREVQPGEWGYDGEDESEEEVVEQKVTEQKVTEQCAAEEEEEEEWTLFEPTAPSAGEWGYEGEEEEEEEEEESWGGLRSLVERMRAALHPVSEDTQEVEEKEAVDWEEVKRLLEVAREVLLKKEEKVEEEVEVEQAEEEAEEEVEEEVVEEAEEAVEQEVEEVEEEVEEEVVEEEVVEEEVVEEEVVEEEVVEEEVVEEEVVEEAEETIPASLETLTDNLSKAEKAEPNPQILHLVEDQILSHVTQVTTDLESGLNSLVNEDLLSRIIELDNQLRNNSIEESRRLYLALKLQRDELAESQSAFLSGLEEQLRAELAESLQEEKEEALQAIVASYKKKVDQMRDLYIDHLDDFVYSREMLQKGRLLAQEEAINQAWTKRMQDEIALVEKELQDEQQLREEELQRVHAKMQELIDALRKQEAVLSSVLRTQDYQRCFVEIQEEMIRGGDIHDALVQLQAKSADDQVMQHLIEGIPATYTHQIPLHLHYLIKFNEVYNDARAASKTPDDSSFGGYLLGRTVAAIVGTAGVDENDPLMKIERMKNCLQEGDLEEAYRIGSTLEGGCREVLGEWLKDVEERLQFEQALEQIKMHIERNL